MQRHSQLLLALLPIPSWTPPTATDEAGIQSIVSDHQPGVEVSIENPITVIYTVTDKNGH